MPLVHCSQCGSRISGETKACPRCGAPAGTTIPQGRYELLRSMFILTACIVMFILAYSLIHGGKFKHASSRKKDLSSQALLASQEIVSRKLILPSTARFPEPSQARVTQEEQNQFTIRSYVDAQNRAGETLRKNYECVVRYEPEKARWRLVKVTLEK